MKPILGPLFPCLELDDPGNDKLINYLATFLELRMNRKNLLLKDWQQKREDFRNKLIEVEKESIRAQQDVVSLQATHEQERKKVSALETRLMNSESELMGLQHQLQQKEANLVALKHEVDE
jgi:predicted  nucleic acid-binding Zn-ribbon protein